MCDTQKTSINNISTDIYCVSKTMSATLSCARSIKKNMTIYKKNQKRERKPKTKQKLNKGGVYKEQDQHELNFPPY